MDRGYLVTTTTQKCLNRVRRLMASGELGLAASLCANYLRKCLDDGQVWQIYGRILAELGDFPSSVEALERSSVLVPLTWEEQLKLAEGYVEVGKINWARELLVELCDGDLATFENLPRIAVLFDRIGLPNYSVRACRKAIQLGLETAQIHFDMSYFLARCGAPPHIVSGVAYKAIELDPRQACYRLALARYLANHGRCEEAIDVLDPVTHEQLAEVTCPFCLRQVQDLYERVGNWPLARVCLLRRRALGLKGGC